MIKALIEKLALDAYLGKALKEELAGYRSLRFQRWRIIYAIDYRSTGGKGCPLMKRKWQQMWPLYRASEQFRLSRGSIIRLEGDHQEEIP